MTIAEVYSAIVNLDLYQFKADNPSHIVRNQIRRHCQGLDFPSASPQKHFILTSDGKYFLLNLDSHSKNGTGLQLNHQALPITDLSVDNSHLDALRRLYEQYIADFRQRLLVQLRSLDPTSFEKFCRNLLAFYGFREVVVTQVSKDGGVDGYGKLKVGFAYFKVAFQCKRWNKKTIGRPEIDKFRGAIQGQYEQGIFFTTASFSPDAEKNSLKSGAVPIILFNGETIVDFMIENKFGVEMECLPVYNLALDLVIGDE